MAVTNYDKFNGLKEHEFSALHFRRWAVQNQPHQATVKIGRAACLLEALEENSFPHLLLPLESAWVSWLGSPPSSIQQAKSGQAALLTLHHSRSARYRSACLPLSLIRILVCPLPAPGATPRSAPSLKMLTSVTSAGAPPAVMPWHIHRFWRSGCRHLWGL